MRLELGPWAGHCGDARPRCGVVRFFLNYFPASGGWHVLAVWCLVGGNMSMQQKRAALASDLGLPADEALSSLIAHGFAAVPSLVREEGVGLTG